MKRMRPERLHEPGRVVAHVVLVALGWFGFGWLWSLVLVRPWDSADLRVLILGTLLIVPLLTLAWVAHNVAIHRRRGPRRQVRTLAPHYLLDFNGRAVVADFEQLRSAPRIVIGIDGDRKHYRSAGPSPVAARPQAAPVDVPSRRKETLDA
jgi:hypothetical protein